MPQQRSAGVLLYRRRGADIQVLLGHPGGPYWARKDAGAWMVPKGAIEPGESALDAALREFAEEVGPVPPGIPEPLLTVRQNGGKLVEVFALDGEFDPAALQSAPFELEWPPRSGRMRSYPELDRVKWMGMAEARTRILASQMPVLDALEKLLAGAPGEQEQQQAG
ncbi:putative NUDIX family NTP pyrophosphohydrolase [Sphingomonas kaistensis]|uniref:Putative NUDIX family NTP pyrophosphohydrolase n=1 Tax=Sphingomonas kaistensis TaxID=298708 RepID=A0A7X5Y4Y5_9SPHN|nr:NUDIX domain-containing protein [Sphingomonas kaistensis]NJC05269.1 putative NUDIX family NTP pyrophosphohydrolase [Sphingomonas kaistensis]